jgi:hypothetical protein
MKKLSVLVVLLAGALHAQSSFRIFDDQMNDVTSGVIYIADTNAAQILCNLTVENIDSVSYDVTAGRLVLTAPVTSSNAMIWGMTQYPPNADSSVTSEIIAPAGTQMFQGLYFPNNNGGIATINYCFWNRYDMNNYSCVTVTYDNHFPAGMTTPLAPPAVSFTPNPAPTEIGVGWYGWVYTTVNLYSSNGELVETRDVRGQYECGFDLRNLPSGIYMISCVDDYGRVYNSRFVH